jgi:hypothetical protein
MASPIDVIIFFVGLTLWSEQVPYDCGVKAILPRVGHSVPAVPTGTVPEPEHAIENHKAALIFRAESLVSQTGWDEVRTLPLREPGSTTEPVYKYVVLEGDSVRFLTNGAANEHPSLTGMKLPKLGNLCPAMLNLRSAFQAPAYPGAAAVITLPEGAVRACLSVPAESQGRLDARLDLKTTGNLVIAAIAANKIRELRLEQQADRPIELIVANVPESYYKAAGPDRERDAMERASHVHAYYDMGEPATGCAASLQPWWDHLDPEGIDLCAATFPAASAASMPPDVTLSMARNDIDLVSPSGANYECSNTQWP